MDKAKTLAKRFRAAILDGTWIANTNFKEQILDLSYKEANLVVNSYNSIARLTFHINYYIEGLIKVFEGGPLDIRDKYSFDMDVIVSQDDWVLLRNNFLENAENLASLVEVLSDEKLSTNFVDEKYGSYLDNINAMIEHCYYHLGQVVLIKKTIRSNTKA